MPIRAAAPTPTRLPYAVLDGDVGEVLDVYFRQCSVLVTARDLAVMAATLANSGVNPVTGDYSRGAAGYWVENGEIAYPVQEITIAGNLKDMYRGIAAIGNDVLRHGSRQCGSILIDRMTIAGD